MDDLTSGEKDGPDAASSFSCWESGSEALWVFLNTERFRRAESGDMVGGGDDGTLRCAIRLLARVLIVSNLA